MPALPQIPNQKFEFNNIVSTENNNSLNLVALQNQLLGMSKAFYDLRDYLEGNMRRFDTRLDDVSKKLDALLKSEKKR